MYFVAKLSKKCWYFSYILVPLLHHLGLLSSTLTIFLGGSLRLHEKYTLISLLPNFVKKRKNFLDLIRNKIMKYKRLSLELYFFNIKTYLFLPFISLEFSLSFTHGCFLYLLCSCHRKCLHTVIIFSFGWSSSNGVNSGEWTFFSFCISCSNWVLTSLTQKPQVSVSPKLRPNNFLHLISSLPTNLLFPNLSFSLAWPCYLSLIPRAGRGQRCPVSVMRLFLQGVCRVQGRFMQRDGALLPVTGASLCHQWEPF